MIQRARANGLPFEVISCDSWYGRDSIFRANLDADGERYIADILADTDVYLSPPVVDVPKTPKGKPPQLPHVRARQTITHRDHTQDGELSNNRSLATFLDGVTRPSTRREAFCQFRDGLSQYLPLNQLPPGRFATRSRPSNCPPKSKATPKMYAHRYDPVGLWADPFFSSRFTD